MRIYSKRMRALSGANVEGVSGRVTGGDFANERNLEGLGRVFGSGSGLYWRGSKTGGRSKRDMELEIAALREELEKATVKLREMPDLMKAKVEEIMELRAKLRVAEKWEKENEFLRERIEQMEEKELHAWIERDLGD